MLGDVDDQLRLLKHLDDSILAGRGELAESLGASVRGSGGASRDALCAEEVSLPGTTTSANR